MIPISGQVAINPVSGGSSGDFSGHCKVNLLSKGSLSAQASYKAQSNNRITETENKCSDQAEKLSVLLH